MNPVIKEWVEKAETDYNAAIVLSKASDMEFPDPVCFHRQQCAEKFLKAFLTSVHVNFPKNHDLSELLNLALPLQQDLEFIAEELCS